MLNLISYRPVQYFGTTFIKMAKEYLTLAMLLAQCLLDRNGCQINGYMNEDKSSGVHVD